MSTSYSYVASLPPPIIATPRSKGTAELTKQEEATQRDTKEAEKKLKATKAELDRAHAECYARAVEQSRLIEVIARLEQLVKQSGLDAAQREAARKAALSELDEVNEQVTGMEARLEAGSLEAAAKRAEADRYEGEVAQAEQTLRQLHAKETRPTQFKSRQERDRHLENEAKELRTSLRKKETQVEALMSVCIRTCAVSVRPVSVRLPHAARGALDFDCPFECVQVGYEGYAGTDGRCGEDGGRCSREARPETQRGHDRARAVR